MADYVRHTGGEAWGVGVLVSQTREHRTYLFADGVRRSFKEAFCLRFIVPAAPPAAAEDRERLNRGLAAGGVATPKAINLALEAAIANAPDDASAYLVYADWLQQRDDPRGELITLHHQLEAAPGNAKLRAAERALLDRHATYLLPDALDAALRLPRRKGGEAEARCEVRWRMGFLESVQLARKPKQAVEIAEVVTQLLGHPSAHFLRRLVIGPLGATDSCDYGPIVVAIAGRPHPRLTELVIGDPGPGELELRYSLTGDASPLFAAAPALERLVVRAGSMVFFQRIVHRTLRELCIIATALSGAEIERIFGADLAALETLELEGEPLSVRARDIALLASSTALPRLRRLVLRRTQSTQTVVNALIVSPLLGRLRELVIVDGDLTDKVVDKLAEHAGKLAHLDVLDLSGNPLSAESAARLAGLVGAKATPRATGAIPLTEAGVMRRAPNARAATAARELARPDTWLRLGRSGTRLWGEYEGRDHYYVFANINNREVGCSCGSQQSPCKHALALLLLGALQHPFEERSPPDSLIRHASRERPRYRSGFE